MERKLRGGNAYTNSMYKVESSVLEDSGGTAAKWVKNILQIKNAFGKNRRRSMDLI